MFLNLCTSHFYLTYLGGTSIIVMKEMRTEEKVIILCAQCLFT